ncbi:MAG: PSD1 and planctomycete cytochrome C domain-containing protein [Planctomycetota bacterium]|nr:PSD1 and planctomycete cytochrome C domain-containing protein [Planctomycetota bacterium]
MASFRFAKGFTIAGLIVSCVVPTGVALSKPQAEDKTQTEAKESQESLAFFESKIRPVLVEQCYSCHSQEAAAKGKLKGSLYLDSKDGLLRGGDTGPALSSEHSEESLILKALRYDEYEMPPSGKLSPSIIQDFERWVAQGAVDPRRAAEPMKQTAMDLESGRKFWSLQPLGAIRPASDQHPVDAFIHVAQAAKQLTPSAMADPRVLVRRAWFDLLGIPPTPQELQEAVASLQAPEGQRGSISASGWSALIDGLLERPEYGERWARHWMDIARFAESFGYEQDYDRPNAYHYRDFLIRAFNQDMPFDQMAQWQIAGDELAPENPLAWMATGFLGAGAFPTQLTEREFESTRYNELDDMTATTSVAFLGLSIGCARCHDHKFDPISSEDYYRFAASFTAAIRSEKMLDLDPEANRKITADHAIELGELRRKLMAYEAEQLPIELAKFIGQRGNDPAKSLNDPWRNLRGDLESNAASPFKLQADGSYLAIGDAPNQETITFTAPLPAGQWTALRIEALADPTLPRQGPGRANNGNFALGNLTVEHLAKDQEPTKWVLEQPQATHQQNADSLSIAASIDSDPVSGWAIDGQIGKSQAAVFRIANAISTLDTDRLRVTLSFNHPNAKHAMGRMRFSISKAPSPPVEVGGNAPPADVLEAIAKIAEKLPMTKELQSSDAWKTALAWYQSVDPQWIQLNSKFTKLQADGPALQRTNVLVTTEGEPHLPHHADDRGYPHFYPETHLLRRGDVDQKGAAVSPGVPKVFLRDSNAHADLTWADSAKTNSKSSYRRAALAKWLTDTNDGTGALVARVIVNRLWQHHFGRGLVATPNDFGSTGQRPTHPELLDWMAQELIEQGWKLKALHRLLMTSQTYMQTNRSLDDSRLKTDPDNLLWWHQPPRRLEAESIRDSMLVVSGLLDRTMYGPGTLDPNMKRRSIYFFIKRSQLVPMMMLFDWPEHLVSIGQRQTTTIAPQALAFMNNPIARAAAETLANQISDLEQLDQVFLKVLSRSATHAERQAALRFIAQALKTRQEQNVPQPEKMAIADFCQILLCANEFIYVD